VSYNNNNNIPMGNMEFPTFGLNSIVRKGEGLEYLSKQLD